MNNQLNPGREGSRGDLRREAFGVQPACWRFRSAPGVLKREQAPRTPNASRGLDAPTLRCSIGKMAFFLANA